MPNDRSQGSAWPGIACAGRAAYLSIALAVAAGLSGCASVGHSSADRPSYVGVFTGSFIDGLPLYRLPSITVVGRRAGGEAD